MQTNNNKPEVDPEWVLDPEIPANYIPVIGEDELYMVVDKDGGVIKYRHREKAEDGSWIWKDVDPHIPEDYIPVEGLENVYKVVAEDGSVKYMKYTRNADDTFFFTEVDENGNPIEDIAPKTDTIPDNYMALGNDIYAVYNEFGVLIAYMQRYTDDAGNVAWREIDNPFLSTEDVPQGNEIISGSNGLNLPSAQQPSVGTTNSGSSSGSNMVVNIITGSEGEKEGYSETETFTYTDTVDGWVVVYEMKVTRIFDIDGELVSTKKEGPTEINRFPSTVLNEEVIPGFDPNTGEYTPPTGNSN